MSTFLPCLIKPIGPRRTVNATVAPTSPSPSFPLLPRRRRVDRLISDIPDECSARLACPSCQLFCIDYCRHGRRALFHYDHVADFQILCESHIYGVVIHGGFRIKCGGKDQRYFGPFFEHHAVGGRGNRSGSSRNCGYGYRSLLGRDCLGERRALRSHTGRQTHGALNHAAHSSD
jgi:hypothetical protein